VKIDQSAPEAYVQFDPGANDIAVFGRDTLSGPFQSGPLAPTSVTQSGGDEEGELRAYLVADQAGNTLTVTLRVNREEQDLSVQVVRLEYSGGLAVVPTDNEAQFRADRDRSGALRRVEQEIGLGEETVDAVWDARRNQTRIRVEGEDLETQTVRNGLVLLRLATSKGNLMIEF